MGMINFSNFGVVDYLVIGGTLLFSLSIGIYYALKTKQTNADLLVGGRKMGTFPISASMMVSYFSAITILGYPAEIYSQGTQIYMQILIMGIVISMSAFIFVPVFFKMKLTSVYEYLEFRFESSEVRKLAGIIFCIQQLILTGLVLYAPSIALKIFFGFPIWSSILGIGICGTIYTSIGGLKAVVWTDVFQFFMIIIGMLAILIKGFMKAGGIKQAFQTSYEFNRLELFDFTFDPFTKHNFFNFLIGTGFHSLVQSGTHQMQVQRYSSLPNSKEAIKAILFSVPLKLIVMTISLLTGIAIFSIYANCDPRLLGGIKKTDEIVAYFVVTELIGIPGMVGLFTSCIFSAVLSSFSSSVNSMVAVTWEDFFSKCKCFRQSNETCKANVSRLIGVFYGIIGIVLAFSCEFMGSVYTAGWKAVGPTSGALAGTFIMALFMPCVNKHGAFFGMVGGMCGMLFIMIQSFFFNVHQNPLPTTIDNCPNGTIFPFNNTIFYKEEVKYDWPDKIYTLSYTMYPPVGAFITITVGLIVSLITSGCTKNVRRDEYLHPWIRKRLSRKFTAQLRSSKYADRISSLHNLAPENKPTSPGVAKVRPMSGNYPNYRYENVKVYNKDSL